MIISAFDINENRKVYIIIILNFRIIDNLINIIFSNLENQKKWANMLRLCRVIQGGR